MTGKFMKSTLAFAAITVLFVAAPSRCFALWGIAPVSKEKAKDMGMEVRSNATGPNHVIFELEFKIEGELKKFSRVDLRFGQGNNPPLTVSLREDRSKPGRVAVSFTADRAHVDKITLWIMVPETDGGTIYQVLPKEFVEAQKDR